VSLAAELAAAAVAAAAGRSEARARLEESRAKLAAEIQVREDESALAARRDGLGDEVSALRGELERLRQDAARRQAELAASIARLAEEMRGRCGGFLAETAARRTAQSLLDALAAFGSPPAPESSPVQVLRLLEKLRREAGLRRQAAAVRAHEVSDRLGACAGRIAVWRAAKEEEAELGKDVGALLERSRDHGTAACPTPPIATSLAEADLRVARTFREKVLAPLLADLACAEEEALLPDSDPLREIVMDARPPGSRASRRR
jgi:hypothetical protein